MNLDPLAMVVSGLLVTGIVALVAGVRFLVGREEALARRLVGDSPFGTSEVAVEAPPRTSVRGVLARVLGPFGRIARPVQQDELARLQQRLVRAGLRDEHAAALFLAAKVLLACALLGGFLWLNARRADRIEPAFLVAIVSFAAGFYLPDAWLSSRTRERQTAIERGLADALDLLVTCVEAGLGLDAALQRVADELRLSWPVLADELRTSFLEVKAGMPRVAAFRRLAERTGVKDLKSLAATLAQTEIFGTSVALALRIQADGIRTRRMQRAEERAAYVSVKMTLPLILFILPTLLAVVMGPAIVNVAQNLLPTLGGR